MNKKIIVEKTLEINDIQLQELGIPRYRLPILIQCTKDDGSCGTEFKEYKQQHIKLIKYLQNKQ